MKICVLLTSLPKSNFIIEKEPGREWIISGIAFILKVANHKKIFNVFNSFQKFAFESNTFKDILNKFIIILQTNGILLSEPAFYSIEEEIKQLKVSKEEKLNFREKIIIFSPSLHILIVKLMELYKETKRLKDEISNSFKIKIDSYIDNYQLDYSEIARLLEYTKNLEESYRQIIYENSSIKNSIMSKLEIIECDDIQLIKEIYEKQIPEFVNYSLEDFKKYLTKQAENCNTNISELLHISLNLFGKEPLNLLIKKNVESQMKAYSKEEAFIKLIKSFEDIENVILEQYISVTLSLIKEKSDSLINNLKFALLFEVLTNEKIKVKAVLAFCEIFIFSKFAEIKFQLSKDVSEFITKHHKKWNNSRYSKEFMHIY